jgi:hypothetical protein
MNNKLNVDGIFCELEEFFDCVNRNILLYKLELNGIVGKFNALIQSYFRERYLRVLIYPLDVQEFRWDKGGTIRDFCLWKRK